jgi:hypothetical protein
MQETEMTDLSPRIDHVVVNVLDRLDEAAETYRRLGFQLTPRGHHTLGSSNNLAIFGTDYLELLGFEPGRAAQRPELWGSPPGLGGLVFKPPADRGFSEALKARGVQASEPREFSRPVELPDGPQDASFRVVNIDDAKVGGRVFFCHHYTPELVWRDEWQRHPNGVTGVREFGISCSDPTSTAAPFARMFGAAALLPTDGGLELSAGDAKVYFLTAAALIRRYGPAVPVAEAGTARMSALGLRTRDLGLVAAALRSGAVEGIGEIDFRVIVPPGQACGVAMAFGVS